jgi:8-oxo-dGTP pyrophosphatase MutT (NUDIX family)
MIDERSYGIIPLQCQGGEWRVLLIQHHAGHWSFPKGHLEQGELPLQAAERELLEETGLAVQSLLSVESFSEKYKFSRKGALVRKTAEYFPALVTGVVLIQSSEIKNSQWLPLEKASELITFQEGKEISRRVIEFIKHLA